MLFRPIITIFLGLFICLGHLSCGSNDDDESVGLTLSGTVAGQGVDIHSNRPILVGIAKHDDTRPINTASFSDNILHLISVNKNDFSFSMDLSESGLTAGDKINLIAFVDVNHSDALPHPDPGDYVGFYIDPETYQAAYVLKEGANTGFNISINRLIRPYTARISGTVKQNYSGNLTLVAYAGELTSFDFDDLNLDEIIGYVQLEKGHAELDYTLDILPFPADVIPDNVWILAILDEEGTGIPRAGNLIGFHTDETGKNAKLIRIDTQQDFFLAGVDIQMNFQHTDNLHGGEIRIPTPSGDTIFLSGSFDVPENFDPNQGAVFLIVTKSDDLNEIIANPLTSIAYFHKMPPGETYFTIDLSDTGLSYTDEVITIVLWDKEYEAGFPQPTAGDVIGYLQNKDEFTYTIQLSQWQHVIDLPDGWDFSLNKIIYTHESAIQFDIDTASSSAPQIGEQILAVAVEHNGFNLLTQTIDMDYVVGLEQFRVGQDGPPYTFDLLPAIYNGIDVHADPFGIENVILFVIRENVAENGKPDDGETVGFYGFPIEAAEDVYLPLTFNVGNGITHLEEPVIFPENAEITELAAQLVSLLLPMIPEDAALAEELRAFIEDPVLTPENTAFIESAIHLTALLVPLLPEDAEVPEELQAFLDNPVVSPDNEDFMALLEWTAELLEELAPLLEEQ